MVVPSPLKQQVLSLAHDPPLVGHFSPDKTLSWILDRFYWPGICAQVQHSCSPCQECQLHQGKGLQGRPLCPMLLVSVPFERGELT